MIDFNNSLFWCSDFGCVVLNMINSVVLDVFNIMICLFLMLLVVFVMFGYLLIVLGIRYGVKVGDLFELY